MCLILLKIRLSQKLIIYFDTHQFWVYLYIIKKANMTTASNIKFITKKNKNLQCCNSSIITDDVAGRAE